MLRLYLLAHAPTPAQRLLRFPADEEIEAVDPAALQHVVGEIGACRAALRGPERRAEQTAAALGVAAAPCPEIRAWDAGRWTGQTVASVVEHDPEGFRAWRLDPEATPHGAESLNDLLERVGAWLDAQAGTDGRVLVVADPAVIRAALVHVLDAGPQTFWRLDVRLLSLAVVQHAQNDWRLRSLGIELRGASSP
jgi:broad specificity phosphatase PhoE